MPLKCTFKNGKDSKFYVLCILPQFLKFKNFCKGSLSGRAVIELVEDTTREMYIKVKINDHSVNKVKNPEV